MFSPLSYISINIGDNGFKLQTCMKCGAIVHDNFLEEHQDFHEVQEAINLKTTNILNGLTLLMGGKDANS